MGSYMDSIINDVPMLTKDDQLESVKKAQKGDMTARNNIIMSNLRLIRKLAYHYSTQRNVDFDDLFQEGVLGCISAINTYDFKKKYSLSTHIWMYVDKHIKRYCESMSRLIRIPPYKQTIFNKIKKEIDRIGESNIGQYSYQQLADICNVTRQDVADYMTYQQPHFISINSSIVADDVMYVKKIEEALTDSADIRQLILNQETLEEVDEFLNKKIGGIDAEIFKRKFGMDGFKEMSTLEICYDLRLTKKEVNESLRTSMARFRRKFSLKKYQQK